MLRRAFMTSGPATVAAASLGLGLGSLVPAQRRVGDAEVNAVEEAVRRIRLLDDRHGADGLYQRAAQPLRAAYALLDAGLTARRSTADRLHAGAGELAISVGWLAHDSGRFDDARSHYAEALATARVAGDEALEAHAFCNTSFLARDAGRHREAVRSAQAGQQAARRLASPRLLSLLSLREAGGWAGLGDRSGCEKSLARAHAYFDRGAAEADPEWMSFFGEPELEALQAQCWAALGEWPRAARHARRAAALQDRRFTRNLALYRAELAADLARGGFPRRGGGGGPPGAGPAGRGPVVAHPVDAVGHGECAAAARSGAGSVGSFLDRHAAARRDGATGARSGRRPAAPTPPGPGGHTSMCPVSFQRSTAGSPYAQPRIDSDVGSSLMRAANDGSWFSQRAPRTRRMWPCAKTSTSRSAERAHVDHLVRARAEFRQRLPLGDPVAPDEPVRAVRLDLRRGQTLVRPVVPLHQRVPRGRPLAEPRQRACLARTQQRAGPDLDARQARPRRPVQPLAEQFRPAPALLQQRDVRPAGVLSEQ